MDHFVHAPPVGPAEPRPAPLRTEEYAALRATIRERGTRRMTLVVATVIAWASLALVADIWVGTPVSSLVPLLVLVAGFEVTFALHVGVERVGRYLQVHYEGTPDSPAWEQTAMRFGSGPTPTAGRVDPLFSALFIFAAALNLVPVLLTTVGVPGSLLELGVFGVLHLAFVVRIARARAYASRQRQFDLAALTAQQSS